ncbi:hypothetical protein PABG_11824 [Paracoccidioides brasiliensis Pb03]|nr:hypothetical protein PABG_11824 [Paracoccidioides brasiliensis Pb03]
MTSSDEEYKVVLGTRSSTATKAESDVAEIIRWRRNALEQTKTNAGFYCRIPGSANKVEDLDQCASSFLECSFTTERYLYTCWKIKERNRQIANGLREHDNRSE